MRIKFRTLIYENWFAVVFSLLITFLFLFLKNIFWAIAIYLLTLLYALGSLFQGIFFSLIFLPLVFSALGDLKINLLSLILIFLCLAIFIFLSFKKQKNLPLITFLIISFLLFYLNFQEKINLPITIIFFTLIVFYFSLIFLKNDLFSSLTLSLVFLELSFLIQFLPFGFWFRTIILLISLLLFTKYDIIKIQKKNN